MREAPGGAGARLIGVVYLLYFVTALFAGFLTRGLVVPDDAPATAGGILAHESLWRSGLAVDLVANALYVALTALLYLLFEPVNRRLSLVAAFFSLTGCAVEMFGVVLCSLPLVLLGEQQVLEAFAASR